MFWNNRKSLQKAATTPSKPQTPSFGRSLEPKISSVFDHSVTASPNATEEVFSVNLREAVSQGSNNTWTYNIPVLTANQKKLIMTIVDGQFFVISVPTANFPKELHVCCDEISGYVDNQGIQTHKIAIMRIRQMIPVVQAGVTTYTLVYSVMGEATWDLGLQRTLSFYMKDDTGVWTPPYAGSVYLEFKIIHVSY